MVECLIVGGGVIGLSLAYELAGQGRRVRVIDAGQPGREASWAGAGILPPASVEADDPLERLTAISNRLHVAWSAELRERTQIDNGFRRCGAIYLARRPEELLQVQQLSAWAAERNIEAKELNRDHLARVEPGLAASKELTAAYFVPDECQIRNPRHLKALLVGCTQRGVEIAAGVSAQDFEIRGERVRAVRTNVGTLPVEQVCLTTGAWSAALAQQLGLSLAIKPIRGQMLLLNSLSPVVTRIINEGNRYLVPRPDGRLLVGSTEEDVGFDRSTTVGVSSDLMQFALGLVPGLAKAQLERSWAGLRPATLDGRPYLGAVPELENAFLAAGHFRGGLQLSTGTALVMSQLMQGETPSVDLTAFRLDRALPPRPTTSNVATESLTHGH